MTNRQNNSQNNFDFIYAIPNEKWNLNVLIIYYWEVSERKKNNFIFYD